MYTSHLQSGLPADVHVDVRSDSITFLNLCHLLRYGCLIQYVLVQVHSESFQFGIVLQHLFAIQLLFLKFLEHFRICSLIYIV